MTQLKAGGLVACHYSPSETTTLERQAWKEGALYQRDAMVALIGRVFDAEEAELSFWGTSHSHAQFALQRLAVLRKTLTDAMFGR